ncbi:MAG: hypothetical protein HFE63_07360 [Clostridiales bacterium]|nr:hypothetical protein [Clostridiales bacterium]
MQCIKCGAELCQLDKALHRKLVNRGSTEFMCKRCLAEHFDTTEEHLDELAEYYRREGCTLFD